MIEKRSAWVWLFLFLIVPLVLSSGYHVQLATQLLIFVILFVGVDIAVGHAGLVSVAHGALFGIGAYVASILTVDYAWPFFATLLFAAIVASLFGLVIGLLTLKLAGHYFVIATMAFALLIAVGAKNLAFTHGELGIANIPKPALASMLGIDESLAFYYLTLAVAAVVVVVYLLLMDSAFGRRLRAIRDNSLLAEALGVDVSRAKLLAFVLSAAIAALGGAFHASFLTFINPHVVGYEIGFTALMALIIGGRTTVGGAILGAAIFTILPEVLREVDEYRLIILGALLIIIVQRAPGGLYGKFVDLAQAFRGR